MITSQTIILHANTLLVAVLLLIPNTHEAQEASAPEPDFHIPKFSPRPESLAKWAAVKQQAVFSFGVDAPDAGSIMNKGFFLSRDGDDFSTTTRLFPYDYRMTSTTRITPYQPEKRPESIQANSHL